MKIAIYGYSGSGKSTLAGRLGATYSIPVLYLDRVQFTANWQMRGRSEARGIVEEFMQQPAWIIEGNYAGFYQAERLEQADRIIFMNFSRFDCFFRAIKRYFTYRNKCRDSSADGCIEKIDIEFIRWLLYEGRTKERRSHFEGIAGRYSGKTTVIRNQKELDAFTKSCSAPLSR